MVHTRLPRSYHWHLRICPFVTTRLVIWRRKKSVASTSICSHERAACIMSASAANRLPAGYYLISQKNKNKIAGRKRGTVGRVFDNVPPLIRNQSKPFGNTTRNNFRLINIIIMSSVLGKVHSLFQSEFCTHFNPVLPLSPSSRLIFSFP